MNVKPGDLAIIIRSEDEYLDSLGRIVKVVRPTKIQFFTWSAWVVEFVGPVPTSLASFKTIGCPDKFLRPISGIPDTDTIDTDQPVDTKVPA